MNLVKMNLFQVALISLMISLCWLHGYHCLDKGNFSFMTVSPPECFDEPLERAVLEWKDWTTAPEIDVVWGFGNETCSTALECFGDQYKDDELLPAQIRPLQIQIGTKLRFRASDKMETRFLIHPFEVSEEDFVACNTSNGSQLTSNYTADVINVPKLGAGIHYFITHTDDNLYLCEFGLRLMVVVKDNKCSAVGQPTPCWGKGRCVSNVLQENFTCSCCHGFIGEYCNYQGSCYSNPCLHNGTCYALGEDSRGPVYKCICSEGYYGTTCEKEAANLCEINPCENGGTCIGNKTSYRCNCNHGYEGDHCEVNVNECQDKPCKNGICLDQTNGFKCYCSPGFTGSRCDITLDLCDTNPCKNHGVCIKDEDGGFSCQCPRGYKGKDCSIKNDLCNPSPCVHALECIDFGHSFSCTCESGYTGTHCEVNVNECESDPCHNSGKCVDMVASFRCVCPHGVHGPFCQFVSHRLFQPDQETEYSSSPWKHRTRLQNLILVAGTLGGAAFLAMMVVALCYCKVNETYKNIPVWIRAKGYKRYTNDKGRQSIRRASSTLGSRPSIDAIMEATTPAYNENSLNRPIENSLKARRV